MTKEEIKKLLDESKRSLDEAHDGLGADIKSDLGGFKKKTLDHASK